MKEPIINDYESYRDKIHILNPDTGEFVPVAEWEKDSDPTRAEIIAIDTPYYRLAIYKELFESETFMNAQKVVDSFTLPGFPHKFRCPTRSESCVIYDARWHGLDKALKIIGGCPRNTLWWTCERDAEPRYNAYGAWIFGGTNGYLYNDGVNSANRCQAVTLIDLD